MKKYPFHLVTGSGRGVSYSSLTQVGDLAPGGPLGQAEVRIFYNLSGFNMSVADHVLKFPEISHPVLLGYFFNSQSASVNTAWRLPVSSFKPPSGGATQFTFIEVDGHETLYTLQSGQSKLYMAPAHSQGTPYLELNESTGQWFRYHPGTQIGELYDKSGTLIQRRDRWGNQTNYGYDQSTGLLSSITGPSGTQYLINRSYNSDGSRSEAIVVVLTNGYKYNVQGYKFDKNGLLTTSYTSYNGQDLTNAYTTNYKYYSISPEPQIDSIQQSDGTLISFDYDTVSSGHYRLITIYLSQGAVRVDFNYSAGKTTAKVSGASGWQTDFGYDAQSRITQVKQYTGYSSLNTYEITQYQYANDGHLQTIIYPDNSQETFLYSSPFGMRIQHQKPNGQQRNYYYDEAGDRPLLQSIIDTFPGSSTPVIHYFVQQRNYNSPNPNYPENETDYLLYKITPQGRVTAYDLYSNGLVQYQRAYLSGIYPSRYTTSAPSPQEMQSWRSQQNPQQINLSTYSYYDNGLQCETIDFAAVGENGAGMNDQQMSETTQYWDIYGKLLRQVKQEDRSVSPITTAETLSAYDGLQRTVQIVDPLQNTTTITYQTNTDKQYTSGVYAIALTQPNGRVEKTILNDQGEKIYRAVTVPEGNGYSALQTTQWYQDGTGRPTVIYLPDGRITFQSFDQDNRIGFTVSAIGLVTEHQWDNVHNWQCDIVYQNPIDTAPLLPPHDPTGNTIHAALTPSSNDRYTYRFYDSSRRLRFEVDANNQTTETQYDTLDRVTAKIRYATPLTDAQMNTLKTGALLTLPLNLSQDRCTSTYYDLDSKVIGQIDPDGWVTENKLDCAGQLSQQILYATPNRNSRSADFTSMRPVSTPNDAITYYFRNARGQVSVVVSPEGYVMAYQYYASTQVQQKTIFYNKVDPNWYQNTAVCPPLPAANSEDQIKNYQYDLLERAVNLMHSDGAARYREYTNMGKLALERHYDARYTNTAGNSNPDQTRTVQYHYDGWDNIVQTATPLVSQLMAENPDQTEQLWTNSSVRDQYDDVTAFKLKSTNTLGNTTIFYYDQERRPVLSISPTGAVKQLTYNNFNDKIVARKYSNKISSSDLATLIGGFVTQAVQALLKPDESQDIIEQFTYDKLSQKINYLDPENYQSTYEYNTFGETIAEHLPLQNKTPSLTINHTFNPRGKEITTERIAADNTTLTTQKNFENCYGKLTSKIDETGALTQYFYDREGVQIKTIDALSVTSHQYTIDALKRVLTDTDAQNQVARYQYNQQQRATTVYPPVNNTQVTTQTNIFNQMVKRTDALGAVRTESHAADGQTTVSVNELGLITQDSVDTESRHTSHIDPIGIQTVYTYDNDNYLITQKQIKAYQNQDLITSYTRDTFGRAVFITNPRGMITQQLFSQRSLVLQKTRDVGTANQPGLKLSKIYAYNGQGSKINLMQGDAQNSNQYAVSFLQDGFNRAIGKIIDPDGENPLTLTSRQALDGVSRTISYTDAAGRVTRLFYDVLGHKRFAVDAAGGMIEWQYNSLEIKSVVRKYETGLTASELAGLTDQTTLDQIETLAATKVNVQDTVKYYFYDANQREQFTVKLYQDPLQTNPQGIVTQKVYDGASRLIQTVRYSNSVDATAISTWTTASLSQLMAANTSAADRLTVIIVDAAGQQCFAVDPRGVINEQCFDALGRIISKISYAELINPQTAAGFSLTQMNDYVANNIANANEDQSDNIVFNVFDKAEYIVKTTVAPQCAVTQYPHDLVGNLTGTFRYKNPLTFSSYADLQNQLSALAPNPAQGDRITATAYDLCNRVINDTDELGYQNIYQRDALDNQTARTDRAGFIWQRSYDRGKRLVTELTPEAPVNTVTTSGSTLTYVEKNRSVKTVYGYDGVNNLLQKTVDADGDEPRTAAMTFWIHNQQSSITVQNVEVDDPTQAANLVTRPTTTQNVVTQTIFNFKLQTVAEITEQGAGEFSVYDSLGRLAYKIDKVNGVTAYTRNNFDEVVVESKYATPLKINLTPYLTTGVPISVIAANVIESNDDRHTYTERDKSGNPITTIRGITKPAAHAKIADLTGLLFYFQPSGASGFYYTQHDRQFDAFNNVWRSAKLITPAPKESWSQTYQWFDGKGNVIASAEAVQESLGAPLTYRVNRIIYDAFYQKIQEIRYAGYMAIKPQTMTLAQLDDYLSVHTSAQDRIKTYQYDLRGCLISAMRVNVNREDIVSTNPPIFNAYNNITLTESYQYDPRELKTLTIHEALPGKTPTQECTYYDSRSFERAHAGIAFTTTLEDDPKTALVIAPLIDYGTNAHGQKVRKIAYINGASQITIDPQVLPTPLSPNAAADRLELKQTDTRGKFSAEQDPNQRITQSTYTLTGQTARQYWQLTNPGDTNDEHKEPKPQVYVDEKRQSYDYQDRVILIDLRRDNVTQQQTAMQYNAFGETVNEGPGNTPDLTAGKRHLPYYLKDAQALRKHIAMCVDGQPKFFTEYLAKADSDWEFKALGVSRTDAVKILFAVGDNPQIRQHVVAECCDRLLHFQASPQTEADPTQFMAEALRRQFLQKIAARTQVLQPAFTQTDVLDDNDDQSALLADKRLFKAYVDSFCVKGRPGLPLGVATMCMIANAKHIELNIWSLHKSTGQLQLISTTGNDSHSPGVLHLILRGGGSNLLVEESTEEAVAAPAAVVPGKSSKQWPLYRTMDQVGRLINTNDHKSCEILFYDLSGAQTAELLSPTQDLSIVEQADFPSLLTQPYTDIEKTQFVRDPAKRLLAQILPEYTAGAASQPQYAPAEILASTLYPALGAVSLSWVTPKLNAQPVFTLYPTDGSGNKIQLVIQTDPSGYSGVDVSGLATGFYNLEIDYYLIDSTTGLPTTTQAYYTDGQVYFPTANNDGVTVVVPTVKNDHVLWLTGAVSNVADIDLVNASGVTVNRYTLQKTQQPDQKYVDLSAETSGHYTAKLISNGVAVVTTPAFIINTTLAPLEAILSREIPATAQINLTDNQTGTLSLWQTLPLDYQQTPAQIICLYVDDKSNTRTFTATLKPDSNQTAALLFDYPVQTITGLTLSLQISADEILPLYLNEAPQTASPVQINFTAKRIVYIRGQAVAGQYTVPPTIQFKDVSQGIQATWKSLSCTGSTMQGIVIDMSSFAPGNYPFILPYGDESNPYVFTIALGAQVFDSNIAQSFRPWVKLKDEPLNRQRLFQLDVFKDNVVASTDTLGYTTVYQYNDLDQEIQQTDPPVTVVNANGSQVKNFQGVTTTRRNVDGVVIGVTLPAGNSQAYVLNEQNRRTQWILGDGLVYMAYRRDGFNRSTIIYDCRNLPTKRVYDPVNMIQQIVPNSDDFNDYSRPLVSVIGYNEKNQRVLSQDPAQNQTLYRFTITGDVAERINPKDDKITTTWDRNHQKLSETWASGREQIWWPDPVLGYFSIMNQYQDLGRAKYIYEYDWKLQQIVCQSQDGWRGYTAILTSSYNSSNGKTTYGLDTSHPVPGQNLQMTYDAGRLIEVNDVAQGYHTVMDYDSEDRPVLKQVFAGAQSRWSSRTVTSTLDALGREINFFDTLFSGFTQYDANGNRRRRYGQVMEGPIVVQTDDNWYNYDQADRPIAVDCGFSAGSYQLTKSSSMFISYERDRNNKGLRYQETAQDEIREIEYFDDGDIKQVKIKNLDGSPKSNTDYHYHPSGYRSSSATSNYENNAVTTSNSATISCDADLFQIGQTATSSGNSDGSDGTDTTTLDPDRDNNVYSQYTEHVPSDGSDSVSYWLNFRNVLFENTYQLSIVEGTTSDDYGQAYTEALMYYDSNGTMNGKVGADNDDKDTDGKLSVYNVTTYDGLVIEKYQFPTDPNKDIDPTIEYYFYDINNNYLSSYTVTESSVSSNGLKSGNSSSIKMRFQGVRNPGKWGHCDLDIQPRTPRQQARFNAEVALVRPINTKIKLHGTHPPRLYASSSDTDNTDDDNNTQDDGEFVQSINNIDLLTVPDKYTVKSGDTFTSIAQSQYGDASFAEMIAVKNNYPTVNDQPSVCSVLNLPQYIPMSNKFNNNLPYNTFQNAIYGNLYPNLIFVQPPPPKNDCTQTLILVACAVTAIVTAPTVAGPTAAAIAAGTATAVSAAAVTVAAVQVAIVAAALDASLQGVALGVGALKHFSVDSVIETGVDAGLFFGVNAEWGRSALYVQVLAQTAAAGAADISSQLIEMSVGTRKRLDINQTLYSMATTAVNSTLTAGMNPGLKSLGINNPAGVNLLDDFINSYTNAFLGSAIMGGKVDLENALGQALGSFIGQEAGSGIKSVWPSNPTNGDHLINYQVAQLNACPLGYGEFDPDAVLHQFTWYDVVTPLTRDDIQALGTDQLSNSSSLQPDPSTAPPNSYTINKNLGQQTLDQMLAARWSGYYSDSAVNLQAWQVSWPSDFNPGNSVLQTLKGWYTQEQNWTANLIARGESSASQWIYNNQNNWLGQLSYKSLPYIGEGALAADYAYQFASLFDGASELKWLVMGAADVFKIGATVGWGNLTEYTTSLMRDTFSSQTGDLSLMLTTSQRELNNFISSITQGEAKLGFQLHTYIEQALSLDVSTSMDSAVFWSGKGNQALAEAFASQTGKTTLGWTPGGQYVESLNLSQSYAYEQSIRVWEILSERYAQGASGNAWAFVDGAQLDSIFNRIEYPVLQAKPNVTIQYPSQIKTVNNVNLETISEP